MSLLKTLYQNLILLTEKLEKAIDGEDDAAIADLLDRRDQLLTRIEAQPPEPEARELLLRAIALDAMCHAKLERKMNEAKIEMQALNQSGHGIASYLNSMIGAQSAQVFDHDQ
jgi:hypothetical protein